MSSPQLTPQSIQDLIEAEFASRQEELLQAVKSSILDALKKDQRALVLATQQQEEKKSHKWDIAQIVLQIVLTGLVGLAVFYTQSSLSDEFTRTNQAISTRYILIQEYGKERTKVYQQAYERLAKVEEACRALQLDKTATQPAISAIEQLNQELAHSELYYSVEILKQLNDISFQASTAAATGTNKMNELETKIRDAKQAMFKEVTTGDIGSLPVSKR